MSKVLTDNKNYEDIADAIRSKGISGTFKPNEMASAIGSIKQPVIDDYLISAKLKVENNIYPDTIDISLPRCTSFQDFLYSSDAALSSPGLKHLIIRNLPSVPINISRIMRNNNDLITCDLGDKLIVTTLYEAFSYCRKLETIYTELDCSGMVSVGQPNGFVECLALIDLRLSKNTLKYGIQLRQSGKLSDESVISIANGLNETVSGQTLTLHATPKARLSTIMGTVAMDSTNTFHIFTADASGATSLSDFITQTKGWSVA